MLALLAPACKLVGPGRTLENTGVTGLEEETINIMAIGRTGVVAELEEMIRDNVVWGQRRFTMIDHWNAALSA